MKITKKKKKKLPSFSCATKSFSSSVSMSAKWAPGNIISQLLYQRKNETMSKSMFDLYLNQYENMTGRIIRTDLSFPSLSIQIPSFHRQLWYDMIWSFLFTCSNHSALQNKNVQETYFADWSYDTHSYSLLWI